MDDQNRSMLLPDLIAHKQAIFEDVIAASLITGGPSIVDQLQAVGWEPRDETVIRLWKYCQQIKSLEKRSLYEKGKQGLDEGRLPIQSCSMAADLR